MDGIYSYDFFMAEYPCPVIQLILKFNLILISSVTQMHLQISC